MSIWDLRQAIESALPWWTPLACIGVGIIGYACWILLTRRPSSPDAKGPNDT